MVALPDACHILRMSEIAVDESRAPIILATFPPEGTIADYEKALARYVEIARRGQRVGWLIDMRNFNPLTAPAAVRKAAAEMAARAAPVIKTVSAGEARVVTSTLVRGVSTAFTWLTTTHWPVAHFNTMADGEAWLRAQLAKPTFATRERERQD